MITTADADAQLRAMAEPSRDQWLGLAVLYGTDEGGQAAAALLASADLPDSVLWASMLVYLASGADPGPLVPYLADSRAPLRVSAAGGLLARGDARGFDTLIAELEHGSTTAGAAWSGASWQLARWTAIGTFGPPLDATADQIAAGAQRWRAWWAANSATVSFADGRWAAA